MITTILTAIFAALFLAVGLVLHLERSSQRSAFQVATSKIAALANRGAPVDFSSLESIHKSQTSSEDTAAWIHIFDRLMSDDFKSQCFHSRSLQRYLNAIIRHRRSSAIILKRPSGFCSLNYSQFAL